LLDPRLAHQPQRREVQPLPHPGTATLADVQLPLTNATTTLHQVQPQGLHIRAPAVVISRVTAADPQHAGRRYADDAALRLQDGVALGEASQPGPAAGHLVAVPQDFLRESPQLGLLHLPLADAYGRRRGGHQLLGLLDGEPATAPLAEL